MKKIFVALFAVLILLSNTACSDNVIVDVNINEEVTAQPDSAQTLSEQIGFDISAPATAKNVEYAIINDTIAQITFSFNSIIYEYRASKIYSGSQLHKKTLDENSQSELDIGQRATVELYRDTENGLIAQWSAGGTNYSLYSVKNVSEDAITELCDLLIP